MIEREGEDRMRTSLRLTSARTERMKSLGFVWMVLIPIIIQYTATTFVPMAMSFILTFFDWSLLGKASFVGLGNWSAMLSDASVWQSLLVTLKYALLTVVPTIFLGLMLALMINVKLRGAGVFKAIYFFPVITSAVVLASIWKWFFSAEPDGVINQAVSILGIPPQFWFGKDMALTTAALLGIYQSVGTAMVYFYAGLKGVSGDLMEAAKIDGCTSFRAFTHVTLPLLKPTIAYVLIITTSSALKVFESIYVLFKQTGGPMNVAQTLVIKVYETSFVHMKFGYGSTIAFLLFIIILILSLIQYFGVGSEDYE